ncbi:hypothetical protein [Phaeovulum sp. NW3]|uniref:hypothetical protein n=1 Tax=Phaeovulum sp. NW3 TaxID=2934933 RepID=UPI002020356F|nr:hypothetical protein [Phaeovulum sp. NW3]MCL7466753.1 hypothetical protein [Phaeovulum sp. NW3]
MRVCTKRITPALVAAGWDVETQIREEVSFTKGRIIVRGKLVSRGKGKRADYILSIKQNIRLFNEASIFAGLCTRQEVVLEGSMPLREIMDFCSLDAGHTETFDFVPPQMTKDELLKRFVAVETETTRIGAVFVTKTGKRSEPLQRMITPWDVLSHFHGNGRRGA